MRRNSTARTTVAAVLANADGQIKEINQWLCDTKNNFKPDEKYNLEYLENLHHFIALKLAFLEKRRASFLKSHDRELYILQNYTQAQKSAYKRIANEYTELHESVLAFKETVETQINGIKFPPELRAPSLILNNYFTSDGVNKPNVLRRVGTFFQPACDKKKLVGACVFILSIAAVISMYTASHNVTRSPSFN